MNTHKYDSYSTIHNFFFHPLHRQAEKKAKAVLAVITNIFLTAATGGLWQIPFWIVNRLDSKKVAVLNKGKTTGINKASAPIFGTTPSRQGGVTAGGKKAPARNVTGEGPPIDLSKILFGKTEWERYFADDVGNEPDLPRDEINNILACNCPIFSGKKIWETHILVLIPEKVDGQPLTLESLGELVKTPKAGSEGNACPQLYLRSLTDECKTQSSPSHWVLITKDVIGGEDSVNGTRDQTYEKQKQMVHQIAVDSGLSYTVPTIRDAAVAQLMHYVRTRDRLFSDVPTHTYTRCQETDERGYPIVIGDFAPWGDYVFYSTEKKDVPLGMAASIVIAFRDRNLSKLNIII